MLNVSHLLLINAFFTFFCVCARVSICVCVLERKLLNHELYLSFHFNIRWGDTFLSLFVNLEGFKFPFIGLYQLQTIFVSVWYDEKLKNSCKMQIVFLWTLQAKMSFYVFSNMLLNYISFLDLFGAKSVCITKMFVIDFYDVLWSRAVFVQTLPGKFFLLDPWNLSRCCNCWHIWKSLCYKSLRK